MNKQDILQKISNREEFAVKVDNKLEADIVKCVLTNKGLHGAENDAVFKDGDKFVYFSKHPAQNYFWCTAIEWCEPLEFKEFMGAVLAESGYVSPKSKPQTQPQTQQEVKYKHFRKYNKVIKMSGVDRQVSNLGGFTLAFHECPNDEMAVAMAFCSDEDNFNREVGRQVSRKRLFSLPFLMMNYELEELLRMSYEEVLEHPEFSHMYKIAMGRS